MTVHDLLAVEILETFGGLTELGGRGQLGCPSRTTNGTYEPQRIGVWVLMAVAIGHH